MEKNAGAMKGFIREPINPQLQNLWTYLSEGLIPGCDFKGLYVALISIASEGKRM